MDTAADTSIADKTIQNLELMPFSEKQLSNYDKDFQTDAKYALVGDLNIKFVHNLVKYLN